MTTLDIDSFDRAILNAIKDNARLSNLELAESIPLSHSAISRRIKRMEQGQVIQGYRTVISPEARGIGIRAFVGVHRRQDVPAKSLVDTLMKLPNITACWIVSGDFDIMLEMEAEDMTTYSHVMLNDIQMAEGVTATRSMFILSDIRAER